LRFHKIPNQLLVPHLTELPTGSTLTVRVKLEDPLDVSLQAVEPIKGYLISRHRIYLGRRHPRSKKALYLIRSL